MSKALAAKVELDKTKDALLALGLEHAAEALPDLISQAIKDELAPHRFLDELLSIEGRHREERRIRTSLRLSALPPGQTLDAFYFLNFLVLPDFWLGNLNRKGPWGFFHGFGRYKTFDKPMLLGERLDAIVRTDEPHEVLRAVFGKDYSKKRAWPR